MKKIITPIISLLLLISSISHGQIYQIGQDIYGENVNEALGNEVSMNGAGDIIATSSLSGIIRTYTDDGTNWIPRGSTLSGIQVKLSETGDQLAIYDDVVTKVYIWDISTNDWIQQGNDIPNKLKAFSDDGSALATFYNSNVQVYSWSGNSWDAKGSTLTGIDYGVDLSSDGNILAITNYYFNANQVKVYEWDNSNWVQRGSTIDNGALDGFGKSLSLSANGNRLAIGAPDTGDARGKINLLDWVTGDWSSVYSDRYVNASSGTWFGDRVELSADGTSILVGATFTGINDPARAYFAYWDNEENTWVYTGTIVANAGSQRVSVGISADGRKMISGSHYDDTNGTDSGMVQTHLSVTEYSCNVEAYDDFELGWGIWNDGGPGCNRSIEDSLLAVGDFCIRLDSTGYMTTNSMNASKYDKFIVNCHYAFNPGSAEFDIEVSTDGGASYQVVPTFAGQVDPTNASNIWVPGAHATFFAPETGLVLFRVQGFASPFNSVYLDNIKIIRCGDTYGLPSCTDNIQNGDEEGVDCGGTSCASCNTIYVDPTAAFGNNNGTSWSNAYTDLQTALLNGEGKFIRIVEGTYYPTNTTDRNISFDIPAGAKLFGGYPIGGGTRNEDVLETILSGNIEGNDNSYHVVKVINNTDILINGITIRSGQADDASSFARARGGGLYVKNGEVRLKNVRTIWNNGEFGAGLYAWDNSIVTIEDSEFKSNLANEGSDIYVNNITELTLDNSLFVQKIVPSLSSVEVHNVDLTTISQSIFENNVASTTATDLLRVFADTKDAELIINGSTIMNKGNEMDLVHLESQANFTLTANFYNTIIGHKNNNQNAFDIVDNGTMNLDIYNSYIQTEPNLGNQTNCLYASDGPLSFFNGSYVLDKDFIGIDRGDDSYASSFQKDFNGRDRFMGTVDMGATESLYSNGGESFPCGDGVLVTGNTGNNLYGRVITTDFLGNIYAVSRISNNSNASLDLDPTSGVNSTNCNNCQRILLQKFDASMNFVWSRFINPPASNLTQIYEFYPTDIQTNSLGEIFISISSDFSKTIIHKYAPTGVFVWTKEFDENNFSRIVIDDMDNIYLLGNFQETFDANPGVGSYHLQPISNWNDFILKLDSNGDFLWAKSFGSHDLNYHYRGGAVIDNDNNVILTGFFDDTKDFNPGAGTFNLTASASLDIYISKLNGNDGSFMWANSFQGSSIDIAYDIVSDSEKNYYITGSFIDSLEIVSGQILVSEPSERTAFLCKITEMGVPIWATITHKTKSYLPYSSNIPYIDRFDYQNRIDVDEQDNIYVMGTFNSSIVLGQSNYLYGFDSYGKKDILVQRYNSEGSLNWAFQIGGEDDDYRGDVHVSKQNDILITGTAGRQFNLPAELGGFFDTGDDASNNVSSYSFVLKLNPNLQMPIIYVDETATGNNSGYTWGNAFTNLQDALTIAERKTVNIAEGIYLPSTTGNRNDAFEIPSQAHLIGGFSSGGSITPDPLLTPTILSGNVDDVGNYDGNSYHVVKVVDSDSVVLEGLTIKDGNANDHSSFGRARGGGLYVKNSTLRLENMDIRRNKAIYGGGIFATLSPEVKLENSTFKLNTADFGAAIYHSNETQMFITNSKIFDNTANNRCAIEINNSLYTEISNSLIANNASTNANAIGFIATNRNQACNIYNSTILGESANKNIMTLQIGNNDMLDLNIQNSIIAHQNPSFDKNVIAYNFGTLNFNTDHCYIQGSSIIGNSNNNLYSSTAGDLMLNTDYSATACSPVVDAGSDALTNSQIDINNNDRFYNTVDIGAFENQGDCMPRESLDLESNTETFFNIHPNPTNGMIYLESNLDNYTIRISDILGQQILETKNPTQIDMNDFSVGIYILNVLEYGKIIQVEKVIKQ